MRSSTMPVAKHIMRSSPMPAAKHAKKVKKSGQKEIPTFDTKDKMSTDEAPASPRPIQLPEPQVLPGTCLYLWRLAVRDARGRKFESFAIAKTYSHERANALAMGLAQSLEHGPAKMISAELVGPIALQP